MAALARTFGCLLIACAFGCAGRSLEAGPDADPPIKGGEHSGGAGGTSQGGTSQGGSAGLGGTSEGGSIPYAGNAGSGGSIENPECTQHDDENPWLIRVQIINQTSKTIYWGEDEFTCTFNPSAAFEVRNQQGVLLEPVSACRTSCGALRDGSIGGCPAVCGLPSAVTLKPGEQVDTTWSGLFVERDTLPAQCVAVGSSRECERARHVQPGMYTFSAEAGLDLDCSQTGGEPCSVCTPHPSGGCVTPGALINGERVLANTQVYLDSRYGVWGDVNAASPAPGGDSSGAAPLPQAVQIIFKD